MTKRGFNSVQNWQYLEDIWDIMEEKYVLGKDEEGYLIFDDKGKEDKDILELNKKLSKKFYQFEQSYQGQNKFKFKWNSWVEQKKKETEREKKKLEEKELKRQQLIEKYKREYDFRDLNWIETNIGKYYAADLSTEIYWTIIGDQWFKKGKNIYITIEKANELRALKIDGLIRGESFLNRQFKRNGYAQRIYVGTPQVSNWGVYGIWVNDELFYIGSTMRDFKVRFDEHRENLRTRRGELYIYSQIKDEDKVEFGSLVDVSKLQVDGELSERDIKCMELALIDLYKPKGNLAGVKVKYKF